MLLWLAVQVSSAQKEKWEKKVKALGACSIHDFTHWVQLPLMCLLRLFIRAICDFLSDFFIRSSYMSHTDVKKRFLTVTLVCILSGISVHAGTDRTSLLAASGRLCVVFKCSFLVETRETWGDATVCLQHHCCSPLMLVCCVRALRPTGSGTAACNGLWCSFTLLSPHLSWQKTKKGYCSLTRCLFRFINS